MLPIYIPSVMKEEWDEKNEEYVYTNFSGCSLKLEHSLLSLSKWESNWNKPFLEAKEKTYEETIDYVKCMTINANVPEEAYRFLTRNNMKEINDYISAPMSATKINKKEKSRGNREIITSELIYYWMVSYGIPFECEKWHLNRLLNLIQICGIKNTPPKKMSQKELNSRNKLLNAERRARLGTNG